MPRQYYRNANSKVVYQYDASGVKWKKTTTSEGTPVSMTAIWIKINIFMQ
ncbi:MAG: hypothetical protein ABFD10_01720 [Prolixibacteraceae bacterium]